MGQSSIRSLSLWLSLAWLVAPIASAHGATWLVMRDGSGDYTTIQPAVDGASPGDTILVGPGRYEEHAPFWPGLPRSQEKNWPMETYVAVRVDSLTIRGVNREQVIIGPTQPYYMVADQLGIVNLAVGTSLTIRDLRIENVYDGCYLYGKVLVENCTFSACGHGIAYWSSHGMLVSGCTFNSGDYGVVSYPGSANPVVENCRFETNDVGVDFSGTQNGLVINCTFEGNLGGVQFEQETTGTILGCRIDSQNACISILSPGTALLANNVCIGHQWYNALLDGQVTATGNVFQGGDVMTIRLCTAPVQLNGNHILKGAGLAAQVICSIGTPLQVLDLTSNYWGTTSADSLRMWIWDHSDDPSVYGVVDFEPFSPTPLPTEKKSLGGVKGLYR